MECLHFAKDTCTRMPRYLIDHLHGILQIGVDVNASLHRCVGSLAKNLASQLVQLWWKKLPIKEMHIVSYSLTPILTLKG